MVTKSKADKESFTFENAFSRLEAILETMNTGETSLDDSLVLYEEADKLIARCQKRLNDAEHKIETLVKNRDASLACDEEGSPMREPFAHEGGE